MLSRRQAGLRERSATTESGAASGQRMSFPDYVSAQGPELTFYPGRENRHDRLAFDPGDRRGPVSQSDPEVTSDPFRSVSPELEAEVRSILDESVLDSVIELAAFSPDLKHFQAEMRAIPRPPEPWDPADQPEPSVVKRGVTGETGDRQPRSENQSAQP